MGGGRELLFISISSTNHTRPVYRREWRRTTSGEEGGREGGREGEREGGNERGGVRFSYPSRISLCENNKQIEERWASNP